MECYNGVGVGWCDFTGQNVCICLRISNIFRERGGGGGRLSVCVAIFISLFHTEESVDSRCYVLDASEHG